MARFGFSILLLFFVPFNLLAQFTPNPDWRFENFNSQNHFISRDINNLAIDKHGYVWACSLGVQRFDGFRTIDFTSFDRAKGGLRDNATDVIADNKGRIWISSAGLCYYDDASGKFIYVKADPKHKISLVFSFLLQKNCLWFIYEHGLAKLDLATLKISFTSLTNVDNPLGTFLIDDNTLLVSGREKMYIYHIKTDTYSSNTLLYNHSLVKVLAAAVKGSDVFLGTNQGLFTLKNLKDISPATNVPKDVVVDLLFMPADKEKKYLFFATEGNGIRVYNTISKKIEFTYAHDDNNPCSLSNNMISGFHADKSGRLWIATGSGISMVDVNNQQWKMRFLDKSNINKIARDKFDSTKVWISSYTQGMMRINWKTKEIEKVFNTDPQIQKIYDFVQLSKNRWLLATSKKIIEWSPEAGILSQSKFPVPDSLRLFYNISKIIVAGTNTCFITTNMGLFKYEVADHQISAADINDGSDKTKNGLQYVLLNGFCDHGTVWIASRNGLFSYNVAKKTTTIYRGKGENPDYFFFDVARAPGNRIVCASTDGIAIFNKQSKDFEVINSIANLYKPECGSVISVNNTIWIGAEVGLLNYDLEAHRSSKAKQENPLMQIFPSSPFTIIGPEVVLGYPNGYAYFNPDVKNASLPSDPVIESVYVNNQPVLQANRNQKLVFSHADNSINIAFTAFLYTDPDDIKFRYRLKGADPKWQYADELHGANYAQLEPGDYTFYVQSGNKNGIWNKQPASFSFIINPPYWATWWFRALIVLVIALGLYNLYRYQIKHILAIERIRERIASDFHDDIGSALSSISIFSEVADKQLKQHSPPEQTREVIGHISFQSRAMLDAMDDIIWAVNPQNDHFNDLAVRMREFAIPLLEASNIHFDIDIQEEILNARIKMEARKNIFLIFKECVNNILKHSGCSAMKVSVNKLNNQLELIISDNGRGFDINAQNNRNGLKNMQKRALEINGVIQVTTGPGKGTTTRLLVNII